MAVEPSSGGASGRSPARRRQRSVRVTVAVTLLVVATAVVLLALVTRNVLALSGASVVAVLFAWAALRMMWTEVLQSRRENATDRAATASAYRSLFHQRAEEHAEFTTAMTERLAEAQLTTRELQGMLVAEQRRAAAAETRFKGQSAELEEARRRVHDLEAELARREAEEADALASWEAEGGTGADRGIEDLIDFDQQVSVAATGSSGKHSSSSQTA